ncbi:class I SAM-dependent methyltransferase [Streptomyces sp. SID13031]|uniref:class I SAM-dependent methyltransferase n=1 Tax=Streptomyces sp. SID13031 TaxID=2706046 RepID=UPI0013CDCDE7|nr:class I SAM-dependent methyltransferase [Streptomyces sp. SID13031]NEA37546.1 class I SAM-dependent methyltransferase [Streptomyces sp. SID13031]
MGYGQSVSDKTSAVPTMKADGYYALHTAGARAVIEATRPMLLKAASHVPIALSRPLVIADYGAADGQNSGDAFRATIGCLRWRSQNVTVQVVYSDQPENDYSALFRWLHDEPPTGGGLPRSLLADLDEVYVTAVGDTFYRQVLPAESVTIGFSATAMHWLSRTPRAIPGHIHAVSAGGSVLQEFRDQARADWDTLLRHRARELVPGGFLIVANLCVDGHGRYVGNTGKANVLDTLNNVWRSLYRDGLLSDQECAAATFPQYFRTMAEIQTPFSERSSALRGQLTLVSSSTNIVRCPYAAAFQRHRNAALLADGLVPAVRSWSEGVFMIALKTKQPAERATIVDELYRRYRNLVIAKPKNHRLDYVHAYLLLRREETDGSCAT